MSAGTQSQYWVESLQDQCRATGRGPIPKSPHFGDGWSRAKPSSREVGGLCTRPLSGIPRSVDRKVGSSKSRSPEGGRWSIPDSLHRNPQVRLVPTPDPSDPRRASTRHCRSAPGHNASVAYDADWTAQMDEPQGSRGHFQGVHLRGGPSVAERRARAQVRAAARALVPGRGAHRRRCRPAFGLGQRLCGPHRVDAAVA